MQAPRPVERVLVVARLLSLVCFTLRLPDPLGERLWPLAAILPPPSPVAAASTGEWEKITHYYLAPKGGIICEIRIESKLEWTT